MNNRLEKILQHSVSDFRKRVCNEIKGGNRNIPEPGGYKEVHIKSADKLSSSLNKVCPGRNIVGFKNIITDHYDEMKGYISLASSPQAFKTAWDLKSSKLNSLDLEAISSMGGQIIPMNENSRVLKYSASISHSLNLFFSNRNNTETVPSGLSSLTTVIFRGLRFFRSLKLTLFLNFMKH